MKKFHDFQKQTKNLWQNLSFVGPTLKYILKCNQRMNPQVFNNSLTFYLVLTEGGSFHLSIKMSQHLKHVMEQYILQAFTVSIHVNKFLLLW